MHKLHAYLELSLADFRERTRRSSFIVMLLAILFFGYLVITGKYTVQFGEYRTIYDARWAGGLMASCSAVMLGLFGFYMIKGSIKRDRMTEVGQIIAATLMTKRAYITSKLISNVMVLWFMVGILAVMSFLTLLIRNEAAGVDIGAFLVPFLVIALPAMIFVAAMAVFFESARWLRGSIGNVVYLFAAETCIVLGVAGVALLDLGGINLFTSSIQAAAKAAFPGESIPMMVGFVMFDPYMQGKALIVFQWHGIEWTSEVFLTRVMWTVAGLAVTALAVPLFDRFDSSKAPTEKTSKKKKELPAAEVASIERAVPDYNLLAAPSIKFSLLRMITAELRLALKGYHWFWYLVAIGLLVAQTVVPFEITREYLTPLSMIWPLVIWSSMGTREAQHGTGQLLFSSPRPLHRQFPAIWLTGLLVALVSVSPMAIRSLPAGNTSYTAALLVGAFFVPSAALAFGTLSKSRRLFEVAYLMFWYVGSIEHLAAIDLLGTTDESVTTAKLVLLGVLTLAFLATAFITRRARLVRA